MDNEASLNAWETQALQEEGAVPADKHAYLAKFKTGPPRIGSEYQVAVPPLSSLENKPSKPKDATPAAVVAATAAKKPRTEPRTEQ